MDEMNTTNSPCGLTEGQLHSIRAVLRRFPEVSAAAVFGSRAKGNHAHYADVDIAVYGVTDALLTERIADALDELPTVLTFDVTAYATIQNAALKAHVDRAGVKIL